MMKVGSNEMTRISQRVGKIAVLMGGAAAEREISLKSGRAIWQALDRSGFDAEPVVWDGKSLNIFDEERFQFFFIAVHGKGGEDGSIQAVLDIKGVPYTGSGILSSALGMDKRKSKIIWRHMGLRTRFCFRWQGCHSRRGRTYWISSCGQAPIPGIQYRCFFGEK